MNAPKAIQDQVKLPVAHRTTLDDFARPEAFVRRYPDVVGSPSRLRYLLRHRDGNGLTDTGAVVQRGRQLYICVPRFRDWLIGEENNQLK